MATGVVSMAAVPPSVVYSVSSPSSASPHILPKHATTPTTIAHSHPQSHPDRQADRHLQLDRSAEQQNDRQTDRQAELPTHSERRLDRQMQTSSGSSSAAPPSGPAVSIRPCSPSLQIQMTGMTASGFYPKQNFFCVNHLSFLLKLCLLQAVHQVPPNYHNFH